MHQQRLNELMKAALQVFYDSLELSNRVVVIRNGQPLKFLEVYKDQYKVTFTIITTIAAR